MTGGQKHIVWVLANSSSAPYFTWFAEMAARKKDFRLSFICMFREEPVMIKQMSALGFECYWIPYDWSERKMHMIRAWVKMRRLLRKIKPDVVHSHLFDDSLVTMVSAAALEIPKRVVTKGDASYHYFHTPQWTRFDRLINRKATDIIALSGESRSFIIDNENADASKVHLVHHGLNIPAVTSQKEDVKKEMRLKWNLEDKCVVGSVSRFIPWKGYMDIVDVVKRVTDVNKNVRFLFCGSGEQEQMVRDKVKSLNVEEYVVFTGPVPADHMPSLYGVMNIFLHAARHEPFGLVIAEAMLNGVPVVSTRTGAAADAVISGEHGYLCEYGNTQALADSILKLTDANLAQSMGQKCISRATEMFSIETGYQNHLKIYQHE